ncbi:MAG: toll/interleukin-1 receptor domain-containing protein [candidate division KSB1 bacterium]|nr:toll/interleukin-1 receptor domain-containing protein [candidate division KSB1 bacterium]
MAKKTTKRNRKIARTGSRKRYVVFVSHSSKDEWIARVMAEKIDALGAKTWLYEKDLEGGTVILEEIIKKIQGCDEAIVLVSFNSINSQWVIGEIGAVLAQRKRLTPILNHTKPDDVALLKGVAAIELNRFGQFLLQLKKRIKR